MGGFEALDDFRDRGLRRRVGFGVPDPHRLDGLGRRRPGERERHGAAEQARLHPQSQCVGFHAILPLGRSRWSAFYYYVDTIHFF